MSEEYIVDACLLLQEFLLDEHVGLDPLSLHQEPLSHLGIDILVSIRFRFGFRIAFLVKSTLACFALDARLAI